MSEMLETAFILAQATDKSLVVVDEVGKYSPWFIKGLFVALLRTSECCTKKWNAVFYGFVWKAKVRCLS